MILTITFYSNKIKMCLSQRRRKTMDAREELIERIISATLSEEELQEVIEKVKDLLKMQTNV